MPTIITNRNKFITNELKSWAWTLLASFLIYFICKYVLDMHQDSSITTSVITLILKLGDMVTQSHISVVQVDRQKRKLNLRLSCLMTGHDYKTFDLEEITSELIESKSWLTPKHPSLKLNIHLPNKKMFQLTNRYGFTDEALKNINDSLKTEAFRNT